MKARGLKTLVLSKNAFGVKSVKQCVEFIGSKGFYSLKKLILKSPVPAMNLSNMMQRIPQAIMDNANTIKHLKKLVISGFSLNHEAMHFLGHAIENITFLENVNISNNKLDTKSISELLACIARVNRLKALDISFNPLDRSYSFKDHEG